MPTPTWNITWDATGERKFETGTDRGVLYELNASGEYVNGVAWNGLTAVNESPEGADPNDLWADNIKYATLRSTENFNASIEAYTYPDEFAECDGSASLATGVSIGQQPRKAFGFSYRTLQGDDVNTDFKYYKLHLVYGCTASPTEKGYATVNDSPDAITFNWSISTVPVNVTGHKPTAHVIIDSRTADPTNLAILESMLYGTAANGTTPATTGAMPLPDAVKAIMTATT